MPPPVIVSNANLSLYLVEASKIWGIDKSGTSDPYAVFSLEGSSAKPDKKTMFKTKVKRKTVNPKWDPAESTISFSNIDVTNVMSINIKLFDWDRLGTHRVLGVVKISMLQVLRATRTMKGHLLDEWFPIQRFSTMKKHPSHLGQMHLKIHLSYNGDLPPPSSLEEPGNVYFGKSIPTLMRRPDHKNHQYPIIADKVLDYLQKNNSHLQVGLFRISGSKPIIDKYVVEFNSASDVNLIDLSSISDCNVVTGLLTLFLREMPEPIFLYERYSLFIQSARLDSEKRYQVLYVLLHQLPKPNFHLAKRIIKYLNYLKDFKDTNQMGIQNLATVVRSNFLRPREATVGSMFKEMGPALSVLSEIIKDYHYFFDEEDDGKSVEVDSDIPNLVSTFEEDDSILAIDPNIEIPENGLHVIAQYDYQATDDSEISITTNEEYWLISIDDGWAEVLSADDSCQGLAPLDYFGLDKHESNKNARLSISSLIDAVDSFNDEDIEEEEEEVDDDGFSQNDPESNEDYSEDAELNNSYQVTPNKTTSARHPPLSFKAKVNRQSSDPDAVISSLLVPPPVSSSPKHSPSKPPSRSGSGNRPPPPSFRERASSYSDASLKRQQQLRSAASKKSAVPPPPQSRGPSSPLKTPTASKPNPPQIKKFKKKPRN